MRICTIGGIALVASLPLSCLSQSPSHKPSSNQKTPTGNNSEVLASGEIAPTQSGLPEASQSDKAPKECAEAISLASRTLKHQGKAMDASYFEVAVSYEPFDFNRDGVTDCVLSWSSQNYVFIRQPSEAAGFRYAGMVIADTEFGSVRIYCSTTMSQGLCELSGAQRMVHGETQTRVYQFDGTEYRETSVRLSAPHPKFGP